MRKQSRQVPWTLPNVVVVGRMWDCRLAFEKYGGLASRDEELLSWVASGTCWFFSSKQGKLHTVVPLVIHGAWPLEDLSAFSGVLCARQVPVHVNNCYFQCRCSGPAITARAAWPRILAGQDGEEKYYPDIRGATFFFRAFGW